MNDAVEERRAVQRSVDKSGSRLETQNNPRFNFHINASFQPSSFKSPILVEIQIWIQSVMALNEVAHRQYEVARAKRVTDF